MILHSYITHVNMQSLERIPYNFVQKSGAALYFFIEPDFVAIFFYLIVLRNSIPGILDVFQSFSLNTDRHLTLTFESLVH